MAGMADGPNGGRGYGVTYLGVGRHGNPLYILHTCTVRARSTFEYTQEVRTNQTDLFLMWEFFYASHSLPLFLLLQVS